MNDWNLRTRLEEAPSRVAILDSNLILLWISAQLGLHNLKHFKRTATFTDDDVLLLAWLVSQFKEVVTTAYVLAEVSNLANQLSGRVRDAWFTRLASFTTLTLESHVPTSTIGSMPETVRFGVTDAALTVLASTHTLITAEYRLAGYLEDRGKSVINFNHVKLARLLS